MWGDLFLGERQSLPVLLSQRRCQGTEAPSLAISGASVLVGNLDTLTSPGPSIFSSEDPKVAHITPLNPFRPQWVAVFGREDKPQILRGRSQWEVRPTLVNQPVPLG